MLSLKRIAAAGLALGLAAPVWAQVGQPPAMHHPGMQPPMMMQPPAAGQPVYISHLEFQQLQQAQPPAHEIAQIGRAAHLSRRPAAEIVQLRRQGWTWEQISQRIGVPRAALDGPVLVMMPVQQVLAPPVERVAGERILLPPVPAPVPEVSPYPAFERPMPAAAWRVAYRLTPREYHRFRAGGFRQREVFFIANAAALSGEPPERIAQMLYRGMSPRHIAEELNLRPRQLDRVQLEWRTPEWAAAVGEPVPFPHERLGLVF